MADPTEDIMAALFARVASLNLTPALPIAWPNLSFNLPANRRALRVQFIPNATDRQHINSDGLHRYIGLLQISVHWSLDAGETGARAVAGEVAEHFPTDLILVSGDVSVRITKRPHVADLLTGDDGVQIPVIIDWEAYA